MDLINNGRTQCYWCGEGGRLVSGMHPECGVRSVMGGVKCQQRLCERLGGPGCDENPRMTKRQLAKLAFDFYRSTCTCTVSGIHLCPVHSH